MLLRRLNTTEAVSIALLVLLTFREVSALLCMDGVNCENRCGRCEGAACIRIRRNLPNSSEYIALTCLPTVSDLKKTFINGCRSDKGGDLVCMCSQSDYCNDVMPTDFSRTALRTLIFSITMFL